MYFVIGLIFIVVGIWFMVMAFVIINLVKQIKFYGEEIKRLEDRIEVNKR